MVLDKKNTILALTIAFLLAGNIFFIAQNIVQAREVKRIQQEIIKEKTNAKVVNFLNLFVQKVLKTDKEISFEDRLKLENAIRGINDPGILAKWEQFTAGTNEAQIQQGVKNLLEVLVNKIYQ